MKHAVRPCSLSLPSSRSFTSNNHPQQPTNGLCPINNTSCLNYYLLPPLHGPQQQLCIIDNPKSLYFKLQNSLSMAFSFLCSHFHGWSPTSLLTEYFTLSLFYPILDVVVFVRCPPSMVFVLIILGN